MLEEVWEFMLVLILSAAAEAPVYSTLIPPLKRRSWLTPMTLPAAAVRAEVALGADAYISQADPL
eukprot:CAMPEP_0196822478 /NCGR_PEP_ID=MMETSP1362-20130617/83625_1 /TAXON_ID=163516 /ORGANISM="Leptocylindrus danicus, Strain CCMP1856" /LENGTH=64 /DNA_ID=CAMNT_0042202041 /DNA_START=186 /DNA_END=377 /DNA_ORIENTATION=-